MLKKTIISFVAVFTSLTAAASAEYNKYNEESYVNISNATLSDVATVFEMTTEEFKKEFELPEDMPDDTNETAAYYHLTIKNYAKLVNKSVDEVIKSLSDMSGDTNLTEDTLFVDAENNLLLVKYFEPMTLAELKPEYGFGDEVTENTRFGEVRTMIYKTIIEKVHTLSYFDKNSLLVMVNGQYMDFDVAPVIMNDRAMVPLRSIFEKLGAVVQWYDDSKMIIATHGSDVITMQVGRNEFFLNNNKIEIDAPSTIVDGRTLVPLRAVAEALNTQVFYNPDTKTVVIH